VNIENLTILADFLDTLPAPKFDMLFFARDEHYEVLDRPETYECATVACAIGWGPAAGIPLNGAVSWTGYSRYAFGLHPQLGPWNWCFAGAWSRIDNTPAGAAKRIRHLINHGLPENAEAQRHGEEPYIFGAVH
jgi:hypothetical protein